MANKYQPTRTCISCRKKQFKSELLRIVKQNGDFLIDKNYKIDGRGAYVCKNEECIKKLIKIKALNHSLKCEIPKETYNIILKELEQYEK